MENEARNWGLGWGVNFSRRKYITAGRTEESQIEVRKLLSAAAKRLFIRPRGGVAHILVRTVQLKRSFSQDIDEEKPVVSVIHTAVE